MIDGRQFCSTKKMMKEHTITFKKLQTTGGQGVVKQKMKKNMAVILQKKCQKITNLAKK